ncbi:unnamed protein product [Vicia faba]|uniref:Uncharacterized protein n=1 Tax=Vicia faba TaxID=3906 RepID=A0AAV0YRS3_VICFA|nr:unnamed protein product [Vicia faba]
MQSRGVDEDKTSIHEHREDGINLLRKFMNSSGIYEVAGKTHGFCGEQMNFPEKILENLSEDKEHTVTEDISSKINVYCDDSIEKICGVEHSGRVRGLGFGVCPTHVFGMRRHFTNFIQVGSFNQKNVEDLQKKNVESLGEKPIGYEETKEQLTKTKEQLTQTTEQLTKTKE